MKVYILGKNRDDIGTQLEQLTLRLLEFNGFRCCNHNKISSGGCEIDVCAKKDNINIICECKAHKNSINITDWLKFVGKIYTENLINYPTQGILIALSGVNGNVKGHYEQISSKDNGLVKIIDGDDLLLSLQQTFNSYESTYIIHRLSQITTKDISRIDIAYYNYAIYIIAIFNDKTFSVLNHNIEDIPDERIIELICNQLNPLSYYDLKEDLVFTLRKSLISKIIITLLSNNIALPLDEVYTKTNEILNTHTTSTMSLDGIKGIIESYSFISLNKKEMYHIPQLKLEDKINYYRAILDDIYHVVYIPIFETPFYNENINQGLLDKILEIQKGIRLSTDEYNLCLKTIKYSPFALKYSLTEDLKITRYRTQNKALFNNERIEKGHTKIFIHSIISNLKANIFNNKFGLLYKNKYKLRSYHERKIMELHFDNDKIEYTNDSQRQIGSISNIANDDIVTWVEMLPE